MACVIAFALEKVLEHRIESQSDSGLLAQTVSSLDVLHHRIVTAGPRHPQPSVHYFTLNAGSTMLVELNEASVR